MSIINRFWSYVDKRGPDDCWLWTGALRNGYGRLKIKHKSQFSHRVSWAIANKTWPIPKDKQINHTCDNTSCVNPAHLYLGTQEENMQDASPLTSENVREIRQLRKEGLEQWKIGHMYDVTRETISNICNYNRWKEV